MFCPCGSKKPYEVCCGPYIKGEKAPPSPEALMRSRYTAYTAGNLDYIEKTMKEKALSRFNRAVVEGSLKETTWLHLTVLSASEEGDKGTVEFVAVFQENGQDMSLHEISSFKKIESKWYYIDGDVF